MNSKIVKRNMRGCGEFVLYLDFDGVLHHENCLWHPRRGAYLVAPERYRLFQHSALLEEVLEPYPAVAIVLSTSWVRRYGCYATAKRLPDRLRQRVVGATFHSRKMIEGDFTHMHRGEQVFNDVLRRQPRNWLALDDDAQGWPAEQIDRFVQTNPYEGISDPSVLSEFKQKLQERCGTT